VPAELTRTVEGKGSPIVGTRCDGVLEDRHDPGAAGQALVGLPHIREDTSTTAHLLFDADHSLEERIIAEQFLG
jgi:hypothetical protein